jgi:phage baseplate assembly protein W
VQPNVTGHITVVESGHGATPVSFGAVTTVDAKVRHSLQLYETRVEMFETKKSISITRGHVSQSQHDT